MTYFFKVTDDYEYDHEVLLKLSNWLSEQVSDGRPFNDLAVHYGFQYIEDKTDVTSQELKDLKKLWEATFAEYLAKYPALMEEHFGHQMLSNMIANIHKNYCDEWTIWRIDFCYMENAETSGMYFYAIEVDDMYMVQFRLSEM